MDIRESECRRFLRELGKGIPDDERVMVCYKAEVTDFNDGEKKSGWPVYPYRPDKHIKSDENCFVAISSSIKTKNRKGQMQYFRGNSSFGHGLAIMVDDIGNGLGSKGGFSLAYITEVLEPSAVIETSPNNFQVWYFLDRPERDQRWFKAFLLTFVEEVLEGAGGDPTIRDVARLGRMPIGINNKRHQDGTLKYDEGHRVRLVAMDKEPLRYSIERIAEAFGFKVREPAPLRVRKATSTDKLWFNIAVEILGRAKMGEGSGGRMFSPDGRYRIQCPFADQHGTGNPFGAWIWSDDYKGSEHPFVFGCSHHACKGRSWMTFVNAVVMPYVEEQIKDANDNSDWYSPIQIDDSLASVEGPLDYETAEEHDA